MRAAVLDHYVTFCEPLEGVVDCMYLDTATPPLVTTGMGNMIDPISLAIPLPWRRRIDGKLATGQEVAAEWTRVHLATELSGKPFPQRKAITTLYLEPGDIDVLVRRKMLQFGEQIRADFPEFDTWPADAQLGTLSMVWAMGEAKLRGQYKHWSAGADALDFETCARECTINPLRGTILTRNALNKRCFAAATRVLAEGLDPAMLHYKDEPVTMAPVGTISIHKAIEDMINNREPPDDVA